MKTRRLVVLAIALAGICLGTAAWGQPGCDLYDDGSARPASDPNPDVACGGDGVSPPPAAPEGTGSLTTLFASDNQFAGNTFDIVPNVNMAITGFDVNLTTGSATTINIYWRSGTAFGFESTSAAGRRWAPTS